MMFSDVNMALFEWGFPKAKFSLTSVDWTEYVLKQGEYNIFNYWGQLSLKYAQFLPQQYHHLSRFMQDVSPEEKKDFIFKLVALCELEYGSPDGHFYFDNYLIPVSRAKVQSLKWKNLNNYNLNNKLITEFYPHKYSSVLHYLREAFTYQEVDQIMQIHLDVSPAPSTDSLSTCSTQDDELEIRKRCREVEYEDDLVRFDDDSDGSACQLWFGELND